MVSSIKHLFFIFFLLSLVIFAALFSVWGDYSRKERVTGVVVPEKGLIRITPKANGLITKVHVEVGDDVIVGQSIFTINTDSTMSNGSETSQRLLDQLLIEKTELLSQLDLLPEKFENQRRRLNMQISASDSEIKRLNDRIVLQEKKVGNATKVLEQFKRIYSQNAASELEVSNQENRFIQEKLILLNLLDERETITYNIADLSNQYDALSYSEKDEESGLHLKLNAIEMQITRAESNKGYIIVAPVEGKVAYLTSKAGQVATGPKALASILPSNDSLKIELYVPSRAAGFIEGGQKVRLFYDAFPYQKFGSQGGEIIEVSKTVISPTDIFLPQFSNEAIFLVKIIPDRQYIEANGQRYSLQPGMTLSADIILEERKIWEWVFSPIRRAMER